MSSNLKVNSLVPATGTAIGIGTTGGTIDFRCPATFGGNVTIGGTLTYDEVINIDSIGIVTARTGLKVTGGQLDVGSNIKAGNAGVVTATTFVGNVTGTASGNPTLTNGSNNRVVTATGANALTGESALTFDGSSLSITGSQNSYLNNNILSFDRAGYSYIDQVNNSGSLAFRVTASNTIALLLDSNAQATFASNLIIPDAIQHLGDLDCKIRFPGTDTITFETASNERLRITSAGHLKLPDSAEIRLGGAQTSDGDLNIYHNGSHSYISHEGAGDLYINTENNSSDIYITSQDNLHLKTNNNSQDSVVCVGNGNVILHNAGTAKFNTDADGAVVTSQRLAINRNAGDPFLQFQTSGTANAALYGGASTGFRVFTKPSGGSLTERLRIDSNGGVGINTSNFSGQLNNEAGLAVHGSSNDNCRISITTPTKSNSRIGYFGLSNRFGMDVHNGFEIRDAEASYATRLLIDSGGRLGLSVASSTQLGNSKMFTIRPGNGDGIRIIRPGDGNNSPNIHLDLTTTTSGSSLRSGGEAYTTKYHTYNNDILFRSYLGGGTGGIIRLMTADGSSGTTRYWQIDEKGKTEHRSRNTSVKTHEFTYTDGAGGGVQTVSLCTLSNYSGSSTAVAEVTYVGSYGLANDYVHSGKWICGIRRASSNSSWSATANETANGGSSSASLDIQWNNGVLQAVTVGAWMGWTVHVTVTTYNFDLTVNV